MRSRRRKATRRLDMGTIREALADRRVWCGLGIVSLFDGEASHYDLDDGTIYVDVELMPTREPVMCRLGAVAGGSGSGVWAIPRVGTEVMVCFPGGAVDDDPVIIATLDTGQRPDGLSETAVVIAAPSGGQVLVHDGTSSGAQALATKADIDALRTYVAGITLPVTGSCAVGPVTGVAGPPTAAPPTPTGTTVLKGA